MKTSMASVKWFTNIILVLFSIFYTVECVTKGTCPEKILLQCKNSFDENNTPLCGEVLELKECLLKLNRSDCERSKRHMLAFTYRTLKFKLRKHSSCIIEKGEKECNESIARSCYEQFNGNASPICEEVKRLRHCLEGLQGCHVMKHPSYTLVENLLEKHRKCFFVNYSKILEVLDKKPDLKISIHTKRPRNATAAASIDEFETSSDFLPYTFVVVATVCTCLFLVILVVFSVVRHTSLLRRQRHSTVERPPIRLQISPCRTPQRTRRNLRRNGRRNRHRHMYVIHEARQTVSGFFEGNVPPPPYSAVLDETESLRAGDLPPPYQSQPFVAIGVIV